MDNIWDELAALGGTSIKSLGYANGAPGGGFGDGTDSKQNMVSKILEDRILASDTGEKEARKEQIRNATDKLKDIDAQEEKLLNAIHRIEDEEEKQRQNIVEAVNSEHQGKSEDWHFPALQDQELEGGTAGIQ